MNELLQELLRMRIQELEKEFRAFVLCEVMGLRVYILGRKKTIIGTESEREWELLR